MKYKLTFEINDFSYTAPITVLKKEISKNQELHVSIFKNDYLISQVNLISLPHFHHYNVFEWRYLLDLFFKQYSIDESLVKLDLPFFNMIKLENFKIFQREILYIIECILFKIIESINHSILNFIDDSPIKINGLYNSSVQMEKLPDCLKIKIRPNQKNLLDTCELVRTLIFKKPDIKLRLDGNRSFELGELNHFMAVLSAKSNIEYIEEPFKNSTNQYFFNYPMAIDESLDAYKNHLSLFNNFANVTTLILKPSILGISKCFEISQFAKDHFYNVVISSTYEAASAMTPLLYLARLNSKEHHGLDTLKFLPKHLSTLTGNFSLQI